MSTPNHTVKKIALPKGWERFTPIAAGHPGEGWLSVREFATAMNLSENRAYGVLASDKRMQKCTRLVGGHNVNFYRPTP